MQWLGGNYTENSNQTMLKKSKHWQMIMVKIDYLIDVFQREFNQTTSI